MKTSSSLSILIRQLRPAPRLLPQTRPLLYHPFLSYAPRRHLVQPSKPLGFLDKSDAKSLGVTGKATNERPSYLIQFTCKPCGTRSTHEISKQGYQSGSILVTCPSCKNRHVISDHLKMFSDVNLNIEDLMKAKGQLVKRGSVDGDGHFELYEDSSDAAPQNPQKSDSAASTSTE